MSPSSSGLATLESEPRRVSRACEATCPREHVAPDPCASRRPRPCTSLDGLVKGDVPARVRRLTHVSRATRIDDKVAPPARRGRHGARSVSPDAVVWSDTDDRAFVGSLSHGATFSTAFGASLDRGARHGHARMSLHRGGLCDTREGVSPARSPARARAASHRGARPRPRGRTRRGEREGTRRARHPSRCRRDRRRRHTRRPRSPTRPEAPE